MDGFFNHGIRNLKNLNFLEIFFFRTQMIE